MHCSVGRSPPHLLLPLCFPLPLRPLDLLPPLRPLRPGPHLFKFQEGVDLDIVDPCSFVAWGEAAEIAEMKAEVERTIGLEDDTFKFAQEVLWD